MKIRLTAGGTVLHATLDDNATARDFASLLPLTLPMNDLFKREKYAHLPRSLAAGGEPRSSYEIGNIAYWSPGPRHRHLLRPRRRVHPGPRHHRPRRNRLGGRCLAEVRRRGRRHRRGSRLRLGRSPLTSSTREKRGAGRSLTGCVGGRGEAGAVAEEAAEVRGVGEAEVDGHRPGVPPGSLPAGAGLPGGAARR